MKKHLLISSAVLLLGSASMSFAASTLQISLTTGTGGVLTNLTIDSTSQSERLVWGIIVSANNTVFEGINGTGTYLGHNGLFAGPQTINGSTTPGIQRLSITTDGQNATLTDDYLLLAPNVFSNPPAAAIIDGSGNATTSNLTRPTSLTIAYNADMGSGDVFGIVWFDLDNLELGATALGSSNNTNVPRLLSGLKYGFFTGNSNNSSATAPTIPGDPTTLQTYNARYVGADPLRNADYTLKALIPEPSSALLLIGTGSLLVARRRRQS